MVQIKIIGIWISVINSLDQNVVYICECHHDLCSGGWSLVVSLLQGPVINEELDAQRGFEVRLNFGTSVKQDVVVSGKYYARRRIVTSLAVVSDSELELSTVGFELISMVTFGQREIEWTVIISGVSVAVNDLDSVSSDWTNVQRVSIGSILYSYVGADIYGDYVVLIDRRWKFVGEEIRASALSRDTETEAGNALLGSAGEGVEHSLFTNCPVIFYDKNRVGSRELPSAAVHSFARVRALIFEGYVRASQSPDSVH